MGLIQIKYGVFVQRYMIKMNGMKQLGKMKKGLEMCVKDYPNTTFSFVGIILLLMIFLSLGGLSYLALVLPVLILSFFLGYSYQIEKTQKVMKEKAARILSKHGGLG